MSAVVKRFPLRNHRTCKRCQQLLPLREFIGDSRHCKPCILALAEHLPERMREQGEWQSQVDQGQPQEQQDNPLLERVLWGIAGAGLALIVKLFW